MKVRDNIEVGALCEKGAEITMAIPDTDISILLWNFY